MISVVVPTIPPRAHLLERALASVHGQTLQPTEIIVETDTTREGAAVTRDRGLQRVTTEWVAFLDDDDEFLPQHLEVCLKAAQEHEADYVYPWYTVIGGSDPMPQFFRLPWDDNQTHQTTITTLVKTEIAQAVGFEAGVRQDPNGGGGIVGGEDYAFTLGCLARGARIYHHPEITWLWHHHGDNTSGLPSRW